MRISLLAALLFAPTLSFAAGSADDETLITVTDGQFTYAAFEASVEHVDLEGCPVEFDNDSMFCRMTLASDLAHVFVFSYDGDSPLLAIKAYELDNGFLPF